MKTRLEVAHPAHIRIIDAQMRERDREEIRAGWKVEPDLAMAMALTASHYARTAFYGLEPLAMFGLSSLTVLGGSAQVWCFGTTAIDRHPLAFARASKLILPELYDQASVLTNRVDATDERALRWLDFLGATYVLQPQAFGGRLFGQFILASPEKQKCRQV